MKPATMAAAIAPSLVLLACAGGAGIDTASLAHQPGDGTAYALSADELEYDCKQLTGRMQIRLLAVRDYQNQSTTTFASRALQTGSAATFGGTTAGTDPNGAYARDVAMLQAYNRQLAAKDCNTYDLTDELQPKDYRATPTASIKPASGAAN